MGPLESGNITFACTSERRSSGGDRMLRIATRGVFALFLVSLGAGAARGQEPTVTLRGEERPLDSLTGDAEPAACAVRRWLPFARDLGYRFVLSDDQKVLFVLSPTYARRLPKKEHHEVEVMLGLARDTVAAAATIAPPPERDPLVIIGVRTADYPKLLTQLVAVEPSVKDWADGAAKVATGFILSEPLVGAWIEDPAGVDEWQAANEVVHRTAQLLVRNRAPRLPDWLMLGLGWHIEDTVCSSVYCFPYRKGFVADADHTDWGLWLANNFKVSRRKKDGKPTPLGLGEFADWRPEAGSDEFSTGRAYIAFGVARFLAHQHPAQLMELVKTLAARIEEGRKVWTSKTEWRTNPDFQISVEEQLKLLDGIESGFLAKVTDYFQKKKAAERRALPKAKDQAAKSK